MASLASMVWWLVLCAIAVVNMAMWLSTARAVARPQGPAADPRLTQPLLWLSLGYVLGCAFRSALPMLDVPGIALHDTPLSRIVVGRSVATVAELCFAAQWALVVARVGQVTGDRAVSALGKTLLPVIGLAEVSSWRAVLEHDYLLNAVENSLWALAAALIAVALALGMRRLDAPGRLLSAGALAVLAAYLAYMVTVDVPLWLSRWHNDLAQGVQGRSLQEGLTFVLQRCAISREWSVWRHDAIWLSLYFSAGVWVSIAMIRIPPIRARWQPARVPAPATGMP